MNSKATWTRLTAISTESVPSSQGRLAQPGPNGSPPMPVVETVVRRAELLDELESHLDALDGHLDRIGAVFPGPLGTAGAERIAAHACRGNSSTARRASR